MYEFFLINVKFSQMNTSHRQEDSQMIIWGIGVLERFQTEIGKKQWTEGTNDCQHHCCKDLVSLKIGLKTKTC